MQVLQKVSPSSSKFLLSAYWSPNAILACNGRNTIRNIQMIFINKNLKPYAIPSSSKLSIDCGHAPFFPKSNGLRFPSFLQYLHKSTLFTLTKSPPLFNKFWLLRYCKKLAFSSSKLQTSFPPNTILTTNKKYI